MQTDSVSATDYSDLRACLLNCSLKPDGGDSHTMRLLERVRHILAAQNVDVDVIHARDHQIAFGMAKDLNDDGIVDDWPDLQSRIIAADILVIGTPIWLGVKSSVATLVVERLYAYSADLNDKGQYLYYGKTGGCVVTGNEDGVKSVAMETLYALQHIGYTVPPQADCGWLGEIGPGPSYGDVVEGAAAPAGYDSEFTNKNTTFMTWNLMHMARLLRDSGGIPAIGNTGESWQSVANAADATPPVAS